MNVEDLITIIIPSYNTLGFLKNTYQSIRKYYPEISIIIIDDASEDDTGEFLVNLKDDNVTAIYSVERQGHTYWYDAAMKRSNTDVVTILHSDMIIGPNYLENMYKHLDRGKVVCSTRIEPPIHPGSKEKIVKNFGLYYDDFKWDEFEEFCLKIQWDQKNEITKGIFAPWMVYKQDHLLIGGHDQNFAPYGYEDSDIFNRWILSGYEIIQSRDALVYHLTCRGHRWNNEIGEDNPDYAETMDRGRRYFIRKWNQWIKNDEYQMPIIYPKYDTCLYISNVSSRPEFASIFKELELWVNHVIVDSEEFRKSYLATEQPRTKLDLSKRIQFFFLL